MKIKSVVLAVSFALMSTNVFADRTLATDPVTNETINATVLDVKNLINKQSLKVIDIVYAAGTQEYRFKNGIWKATGPKADLFNYNQRNSLNDLKKTGTHFMDITKPGWKFSINGELVEVIAKKASKISGASANDVSWLHVETENNSAGVTDIFRIYTRLGKAPKSIGKYEGERHGSSYETIYVALGR